MLGHVGCYHGDNMGQEQHVGVGRTRGVSRDIITNGFVIRDSLSNYSAIKSSTA